MNEWYVCHSDSDVCHSAARELFELDGMISRSSLVLCIRVGGFCWSFYAVLLAKVRAAGLTLLSSHLVLFSLCIESAKIRGVFIWRFAPIGQPPSLGRAKVGLEDTSPSFPQSFRQNNLSAFGRRGARLPAVQPRGTISRN